MLITQCNFTIPSEGLKFFSLSVVGDEGEVDSALRFLIGESEAFGREGRVGFEEGGAGTISSNAW